jgi:hypothetical protein
MHLGFTPHPIAALVVAALLTVWLGIFYCLPLPLGPDRAMIGLGCVFLQTPPRDIQSGCERTIRSFENREKAQVPQ